MPNSPSTASQPDAFPPTSITMHAMHNSTANMASVPLYTKMRRNEWMRQLREVGSATLCYEDIKSLGPNCSANPESPAEEGFLEEHWHRRSVLTHLTCPLTGSKSNRYFTLSSFLSPSSPFSSVMCAVAGIISERATVSYPQLFTGVSSGFSGSYFLDKYWEYPQCEVNSVSPVHEVGDCYRCFMFLGGEIALFPEDEGAEMDKLIYDRGYACVITNNDSAEDMLRFPTRAISMRAVFKEASWKHRLFPGDILVSHVTTPFVIELPLSARMMGARIISWLVLPESEDTMSNACQRTHGTVPNLEEIPILEDLTVTNEFAAEYYREEMSTQKFDDSIESGDPFGEMERFRVTPGIFLTSLSRVKESLFHVFSDEFWLNQDEEDSTRSNSDAAPLDVLSKDILKSSETQPGPSTGTESVVPDKLPPNSDSRHTSTIAEQGSSPIKVQTRTVRRSPRLQPTTSGKDSDHDAVFQNMEFSSLDAPLLHQGAAGGIKTGLPCMQDKVADEQSSHSEHADKLDASKSANSGTLPPVTRSTRSRTSFESDSPNRSVKNTASSEVDRNPSSSIHSVDINIVSNAPTIQGSRSTDASDECTTEPSAPRRSKRKPRKNKKYVPELPSPEKKKSTRGKSH